MNVKFEQRLHAEMEQATQGARVPPGLALKAYRHQKKRTMTTRAVTAAGAAAVLTAGALAAVGASGAFGSPTGSQQAQTTAYVISRVERALSAPAMTNVIGYTRTMYPAGTTLQPVPGGIHGSSGPGSSAQGVSYELLWAYHHTSESSAFSATGQRVFNERITVGKRSFTTTVASYPSRTWWTTQSPRPAVTGSASASCLPGGEIRLSGGTGNAWPTFIRSQLACGAYTAAGKQAIGGVDALKITGSSGHLTLWVNAATYLPMRLEEGELQTDFQWLPPSPANLAMLNMPIPAGFHQVQPPS